MKKKNRDKCFAKFKKCVQCIFASTEDTRFFSLPWGLPYTDVKFKQKIKKRMTFEVFKLIYFEKF